VWQVIVEQEDQQKEGTLVTGPASSTVTSEGGVIGSVWLTCAEGMRVIAAANSRRLPRPRVGSEKVRTPDRNLSSTPGASRSPAPPGYVVSVPGIRRVGNALADECAVHVLVGR
jgi:hypothetical protein